MKSAGKGDFHHTWGKQTGDRRLEAIDESVCGKIEETIEADAQLSNISSGSVPGLARAAIQKGNRCGIESLGGVAGCAHQGGPT